MAFKLEAGVFIVAILALFVVGMFVQKTYEPFIILGTETMTRTVVSTTVNPNSQFTVTYTAVGVSGLWGGSVEEAIQGGCTINGKTSLKFVMMSDLPNPLTYTVQAPSVGSCKFVGTYQYGNFSVKAFPDLTVTVCSPTCTRPANLCTQASSVSNQCGGYCTGSWTITRLTSNDVDCSNSISRTELGIGITNWISGLETRDQLGIEIQSWAAS